MLGFPIRTPPDHSSVANSPGLIAGSNVLHRLSMPRHPPCALHSLSHKPTKQSLQKMLASTIQISNNNPTPHPPPPQGPAGHGREPSHQATPDASEPQQCANPHTRTLVWGVDDSTSEHHQPHRTLAGRHGCVLLRKEVIQPHLPVRLPCYDFVPIASPTFDGSPHKGWATGFGCCRLS